MTNRHTKQHRLTGIAIAWLALCTVWAAAILVTDHPAWALAVWIATTLGPLAILANRPPSNPSSTTGAIT